MRDADVRPCNTKPSWTKSHGVPHLGGSVPSACQHPMLKALSFKSAPKKREPPSRNSKVDLDQKLADALHRLLDEAVKQKLAQLEGSGGDAEALQLTTREFRFKVGQPRLPAHATTLASVHLSAYKPPLQRAARAYLMLRAPLQEVNFVCRVPRDSGAYTRPQADVVREVHTILERVTEGAGWDWADEEMRRLLSPDPAANGEVLTRPHAMPSPDAACTAATSSSSPQTTEPGAPAPAPLTPDDAAAVEQA